MKNHVLHHSHRCFLCPHVPFVIYTRLSVKKEEIIRDLSTGAFIQNFPTTQKRTQLPQKMDLDSHFGAHHAFTVLFWRHRQGDMVVVTMEVSAEDAFQNLSGVFGSHPPMQDTWGKVLKFSHGTYKLPILKKNAYMIPFYVEMFFGFYFLQHPV